MTITNNKKYTNSFLRVIPKFFTYSNPHINRQIQNCSLSPRVTLRPLNLNSSSIIIKDANNLFGNNLLKISLSPLKLPIPNKGILYNSNSSFGKLRDYSIIHKCNSKRCLSCKYLVCNSTVTSNVNGRTFNIIINTDIT